MTSFNFRSLLLAAIVLSNCITWTASRHHYAHNVHQHRTRHRRQGAGLYLPASYVIPGGEGSGPWGEWGEVSPCSRTCGGGVASQKRICLQPGPEGQSQCTGGDTKYFSCQTQDCPDGSADFRAEQCAEFNDKLFRGYKYNWVPYTKAPNPCELNCMPHGERFYFRHKLQVTDGTKCNEESFDVCVNGKCQAVGCDMMLNSTAREDKCRECRGNGANCRTTDGIFDTQDLMKGYNDILLIPAGSTSIYIEEVAPSSNYLALRAKNGTYYLNGHYHIDFPRSILIAGALWTYERSQQGFAAPDKLRCLGPTNEPLYLSLLLQDENVGIRYEYSVPTNSAPPTDKRYNWVHEEFTPCSATCGGGFQTRNVTCRSREQLELVDDSLCDEGLKPPTNQSCNPDSCPPQWVEGPWEECSQRCGAGGVRSRAVNCQKIIANGQASIVPDKECFDLLGPKPEVFQKCNEDAPCPTWFVGHWGPCDKLCDEGKQTRQVVCYQKKDRRIEVLGDKNCTDKKPDEHQSCLLQPCDGTDWVTSSWSGCDSCTSKNRTRIVVCSTKGRQVLDESLCSHHDRPVAVEECKKDELPACEVQWYATQWSKCSVSCGDGEQTRKVFCGMYYEDASGEGVEMVEDAKCANLTKYNDTQPCTVPKEECPSQWFAGPWSECTQKCGGGEQYRRVMCFRGDKEAADCDGDTVLDSTQLCNPGPCDPDDLLPVSRTSTVVMDDTDDECEDYEEVGLDSLTTDVMMSDSPGYAEHEVLTLETGSGFGSSLSTDDLTTEGSGFSTTDTTDSDYTTYDETGSGETSITDLPSTVAKDKDTSTTTTVIPPTKKASIGPSETTSSDSSISTDTDSTESTVEDTGSTPTDITTDTESTESTVTDVTESTPTADTGSTSSDTGSTSSGETVTEASGPTTETGSTDGSESTIVKETGSTSESGSTSSGETGSSDTDGTGSTTEASTGSTESSLSTETKETVSTSESGSTSSGETITTDTSDTGSTSTEETESTDSSASTVTKETGSTSETDSTSSGETTSTGETSSTDTDKTESTVSSSTDETTSTDTDKTESTVSGGTDETTSTGETESTVSGSTDETSSTGETESTVTETTGPTETTITEETSPTESTVTEETSSTESTVTEETGSTESTVTDETGSTESTLTEETGSTESTATEETGSTDSTVTEVSGSTESTNTEETGSTESTVTEETRSTITSESESKETETTIAGSTNTEKTSDTDETSSGSTDSTTTTKLVSESTTTTRAVPTESKPSSTGESTTPSPTDSSETTEPSTDSSESTVETSTSSGVETTDSESTTEEAASSTVESSTASGSDGTSEASSSISAGSTTEGAESSSLGETTTPSETESTTEAVESSSVASGSTGAESTTPSGSESTTETSEAGSTSSSESTTDVSGSSTEESSTVSSEITTGTESTEETSTGSDSTTETTGAEESTIYSTTEGSTISGSTEETESTVTGLSTTEGSTGTTIWTKSTVFVPPKVCKPRKSKCSKTKFGCCPDRKTTALGPFDEGCEKPRTCKESSHGCCPDGLSPAQGAHNEGCPVEPCADTLFGCCTSDNKTAAQGNDQDGCPPPPPACIKSEYGCCADNETEATGPKKQGCPETETSTTGALTDTTTETTESIETSEGSTTDEGTTDFTITTTLDLCSSFEFGCCADNETEASGPDGQGCPCNATEFGCCPDGVSPASGLKDAGCQGPCRTSPHGCCQDDKTPAHGPDFEGCCLLQAFGCCPDNRKPAEGPHLEGCGCQYAIHGCCPDKVTIAQGPENQGCGCQYTEYGCCPDRHTAASGPGYEGCTCNTYQFGCCPDGVTTAKGPEQQGCHCRDSTFGCCGDGETPATGPAGAGCDCSSSRHGCCPDGRTEATGAKFFGCTDAPENKQAACSLSTDPGPCHNFTAMWYYDMAYGGCSRFWYGGCDGNGNRFSTKEECEDICVRPSPKDACKLPSVKGACDADYQRWHYNSTREQCIPFRYGGCLGNANNFDTRELCQKQCEPTSVAGQCTLPIDQGSCAGNYSRWGFNSVAHRCEQFIWGGCEGNSNRFSSESACQMRCAGTQPPQCTQPQEAGNCTEKEALWSFSQSENRCLPFYYSGCGGNDNRFGSREACEQTCPSAYVADKCTLPAETGQCSNYRERWFYDTTFKRCRQFYYGGCGGNENNFGTEAECENSCSEIKTTTTTTTTTARHAEPKPQPGPQEPEQPERPEFCFNAIDAGPCNNTETRYAYDVELGRCVTFQYGGCGGNQNNFPDETYCSEYCQPMQDICQLPMLQGPCDDSVMRWFYDPTTDSCSQFTYGGCNGNENRFESLEACESRCRAGPAAVGPTTATTTVIVDVPSECKVPEELEDCRNGGLVWYFDPSRHECVSHANQLDGPVCRYTGTYPSQEACERSCGAFRGVDVCKQRKDPGPCESYVTKVYFEPATGQCHEFIYGGCLGGANRFSSIEECSQVCKSDIADPCSLPPEGGNCFLYVQQWYYDPSRDECNQFVYTGCSGNENRFETQGACEARCRQPTATTTTLATPPQPPVESECRTPSSLAPCGNNVTVFYYDSDRRQCLSSGIGGCGHPNSYSTEEECERSCGAFRGLDVCGARLDPGPCRASFPKIYWDSLTGTCQPYAYGGCAGGPNRFSSVEECMNVCGDTGPAPACLQEVHTGHSCAAAPAPRWYYSVAHVDCVVFAYLGCGGNDNNFHSYADCADTCRLSGTRGDDQNQIVPHDCTPYRQECEALDCQYGVDRFTENGCQRCICREDPCLRVNCQSNERCEAVAMRDPATQEQMYSTRCVAETNEVYDCDEYVANCSRLRCEYGVQRSRLPDGCEKCSCVQVEIDCEPLREECNQLKCNYGIERIMGVDGCERCKCKDHPCERKSCGAGERCVVQQYVNGLDPEPKYTAECRTVVKAGACPVDETTSNEVMCRRECGDDADCRGVGKCCRRGCSELCLVPVEQTSPHPLLTTTVAPNVPAAPIAMPPPEPEVAASEGGSATLRCLFHGNPPPKITWTFGELTIDGNSGRYRLTSDGALEIVSLYRNDTGVYICVADNGLGVASQEIHLVVNDPVRMPVGIAGDENAVVTGELDSPLQVRCLAYGYPPPSVFWYRGYEGVMVPYNDAVYEARGNILLIRRLAMETLGQYTCQAYNGEGKAASWVVFVRAYQPEGYSIENEFIVPRNTLAPRPRTQPPSTAETTTTSTTTTTEAPRPLFTVPVSTHVSTPFSTLNIGADLRLTCDVDGFPEPDVHWTKDGVTIQTDGRITITGSTIVSRLTVARVSVADSGLYACHASNPYSSQSDTAQINVQQLVVPAKCTDNPFFADCHLIVRSKFCRHKYYSKFCCKSCVEAGQLDPQEAELQADQPYRKK